MTVRLLAISGSLRAASSNSRVIEAMARLAPPGVEVEIYRGLQDLPHFNPDLDDERLPPQAADLRARIGACNGLIICSPEYAHGVAGAMKNALDWLVPSLEFAGTRVALINASPRAHHAQDHMRENLVTMSAEIVEAASIAVPLQGRDMSVDAIVADAELSAALRAAVVALVGSA